jgi:hypothetical protein
MTRIKVLPKAITDRVSVKNVKQGFGHDLQGLFANIYLDKKNVGHYNDDGWGGEVDLHLKSDAGVILQDLCVQNNIGQLMFDNGWDFMELERITLHMQIQHICFCLIDNVLSAKEKKSYLKKLEKDMLKGICIGNDNGYRLITFKAGDLKNMVEYIGINGLTIQIKTQILPMLKNGDRILNTNLKELGIELE